MSIALKGADGTVMATAAAPGPNGDYDIGMYYFPQWTDNSRWAPIWRRSPERKPALGWYDESNPACVDWQIKWAVEHGIRHVVIDWCWQADGVPCLAGWIDGLQKARYRDRVKRALTWVNGSNHVPGTAAVWQQVVRYWVEHYFGQSSYMKVNGKPVVYVSNRDLLRKDLGGTPGVVAAMAQA